MKADYKLVARIVARQLQPLLKEHLYITQYCGVPGNPILETVATVRVTISYVEQMNKPLCVRGFYLKNAFDRTSHEYLFTILHHYGLDNTFVDCIRRVLTDATFSVKVNGRLHGPIPIRCGVR
jgi:hypothetical protein